MPFENWEMDHKPNLKMIMVIALIAIIATASTAYAVYKITSPPSDPVVVTAPASLSKPTVNATSAVIGDIIQLITTLSDQKSNVQVFFYENQTTIGSAYTNSQGQAIFNRIVSAPNTYIYTADCIHP